MPVEFHRTPAAITYRAQEVDSGREVALELVPCPAPDPLLREKLEAEAKAAKEINHINIPVLHDFGFQDDQLVYVTEYFDGHATEAWIAARGPLSVSAVLRIALQVVSAFGAAAFQRIHHHALNPENILFIAGQTTDGGWPAIKVLHWLGGGRAFAGANANEERLSSAARFASPEQLRGEEVDFRAEIYSLGCTMWYLLTGSAPTSAPFGGEHAGVTEEKLSGVPKIVRHLVARMLRANPDERPQDPVVLSAYLQTCLARVERRETIGRRLGIPLFARPRVVQKAGGRSVRFKTAAIAAALLACASLAALLLPWHFRAGHSARTSQVAPPIGGPNESPNESSASVSETAPASGEGAARVEAPTNVASSNDEIPRDELVERVPNSSALSEPMSQSVPAEGPNDEIAVASPPTVPAETPDAVVAVSPTLTQAEPPITSTSETVLPSARTISVAEKPALIPQNNEPRFAADVPTASPSASIPANKATNSVATDVKKTASATVASNPRRQASSTAKKTRSETRARKKTSIAKATKPVRAIPPLHVGSVSAHLVGKTRDGMWILSLASSGERIVVPPPPGFEE